MLSPKVPPGVPVAAVVPAKVEVPPAMVPATVTPFHPVVLPPLGVTPMLLNVPLMAPVPKFTDSDALPASSPFTKLLPDGAATMPVTIPAVLLVVVEPFAT